MSDCLQPHGLQHSRLFCPSLSPRICSKSSPLSQWCHPTISSSVIPSPPAFSLSPHQGLCQWVRSLPVSQVLASGGQKIGASALAANYISVKFFSIPKNKRKNALSKWLFFNSSRISPCTSCQSFCQAELGLPTQWLSDNDSWWTMLC